MIPDGVGLGARAYGKHHVRALTFGAGASEGEVADLSISTMLRGGIDECYASGDNHRVITSDAQRNLALAVVERMHPAELEDAALAVASELHARYPYFPEVEVEVVGLTWGQHGAAHVLASKVRQRAVATITEGKRRVCSGFDGLGVLVTGGSRFVGFVVDEYTTNEPVFDRPLAGTLSAEWAVRGDELPSWRELRSELPTSLLTAFGGQRSESVQHLLASIASAVLEREPRVGELSLRLESIALEPIAPVDTGGSRTYLLTSLPAAVTEVTVVQNRA